MRNNFGVFDPGKILIVVFILVFIGGGILFFNYNSNKNVEGIPCEKDSDCDDNDLCTIDSCLIKSKVCYNIQKKCPSNQICNSSTGNCEINLNKGTNLDSPDISTNTSLEGQTYSCDKNNLNLCFDKTSCEKVGGFWYNNFCNEKEENEEVVDYGNIPLPPALPN